MDTSLSHINEDERPMLPDTSISEKINIRGYNNTLKIIFLTLCLAGLQFTWTVEMAYGTPYLLSLGLTKSYMSLVWVAGPLSGLIMQPVVGVLSDSCQSKWGRRRPFLVGGSIVVAISLLIIGWTREITHLMTNTETGDRFQTVSIIIAIAAIYVLDFSVNCVQASCRALIVDSLPTSLQEDGTAWAGKMVGLGNVVGYFMGYANLVQTFPFFGNTQLKVLCIFAIIVLFTCNVITCYTVREKVHQSEKKKGGSPFRLFSDIFRNIWNLPKPIQRICNVQFFAWIGWFPFLFYSTTWVAEIYTKTLLDDTIEDKVGQATRAGSFAFLVFSLVSFVSSFLIPLVVSSNDHRNDKSFISIWFGKKEYKLTLLQHLKWSFLTLPRAWTSSHFVFCICMLSTMFVSNVTAAAIVIGLCGISWAISMWAPFSLLGEYISRQESLNNEEFVHHSHLMNSTTSLSLGIIGSEPMYQPVEIEQEIEMLGIGQSRPQEEESLSAVQEDLPAAGILLGIHNMYIVLPQFLVTFLSSIIFRLLQDKSTDAIGLILRIGAIMAGVAGYFSIQIGKE